MRSIHDPPDATIRYRSDLEYLRSKVPSRDATVAADIGAPVALRWDDWGIPHIRAERRRDLFVGLGYATAQECLWRPEYSPRLAPGGLAAVLRGDAPPPPPAKRP